MFNRFHNGHLSSIATLAGCLAQAVPALAANANHVAAIQGSENHCGGADVVACDLSGADLSSVSFGLIELDRMNGVGVNLSYAKFRNTKLTNADLSDANLSNINFFGGAINKVNLTGADLTNMQLKYTDFGYNNLTNANLSGSKIADFASYEASLTLCNTTMPDGSVSNRDC